MNFWVAFSLGKLIKEANIILTYRYFFFIKVQFLSNYNSVAAQMCMFCIVLTEIAHRRTYIHWLCTEQLAYGAGKNNKMNNTVKHKWGDESALGTYSVPTWSKVDYKVLDCITIASTLDSEIDVGLKKKRRAWKIWQKA